MQDGLRVRTYSPSAVGQYEVSWRNMEWNEKTYLVDPRLGIEKAFKVSK